VMIPTLVPALERHGRLQLGEGEQAQLLAVSAATIDRMLAPETDRIKMLVLSRESQKCVVVKISKQQRPAPKRGSWPIEATSTLFPIRSGWIDMLRLSIRLWTNREGSPRCRANWPVPGHGFRQAVDESGFPCSWV
jgi:hypothetical protein